MSTMKAVRIHQYGPSDVLAFEDSPRPQPDAGVVLVRVRASSVNPIDWKIRAGYLKQWMPIPMPFVPGRDVSGIVEAVGPGVSRFKKGDEVFGLVNGAYAEFVAAREEELARKPRGITHAQAAAIPLAALTAWQALFDKAQLQAGQTVLVHGAAGGVGSFAVQFAKVKGARVIATASQSNQAFVKELGADQAIDYAKERFEEAVRGVDVVFDTIGGETQQRSYAVLRRGGILVSVAAPPSADEAAKHGVRAEFLATQPDATQLGQIAQLVEAGEVKPQVGAVMSLADVRRAHQMSETGHMRGKIVLSVA